MNRVQAISGWGDKGPACFLAEIDGRRLMLDLGEGPDAGRRPDLTGIGAVDAILISHGHPDHVGALDLAPRIGDPPIFATAPVRALASDERLRLANDLPLSGAASILGLDVETGPAGHAPGAVWTRIGGEGGLLYTGDYSQESLLYPASRPLPAAAMTGDASYGDAEEPLDDQTTELVERARWRPLLLPAPPTGRALEMALALHGAGIEVALCPATRAVGETLARHPEAMTAGFRDAFVPWLASTPVLAVDSPARGAMIVAGAQADHGLSAALCERFAASGEADIVFTGHVAEGSQAQQLMLAEIATLRRWNVHPTRSGLKALLDAVRPEIFLPAFLRRARIPALMEAFPGVRMVSETGAFRW